MSFDRLALALANVEINEISEIELVRLIRASVNEGQSDMNKVTPSTGLVIAKALKLLMHKAEIRRLVGKVEQRGFTLVPMNLHYKGGRVKAEDS